MTLVTDERRPTKKIAKESRGEKWDDGTGWMWRLIHPPALYMRPRVTSHEVAISKLRAPSTELLPSPPCARSSVGSGIGSGESTKRICDHSSKSDSLYRPGPLQSILHKFTSLSLLIITIYGLLLVSTRAAEGRYLPPVVTKSIVVAKGKERRGSQPSAYIVFHPNVSFCNGRK